MIEQSTKNESKDYEELRYAKGFFSTARERYEIKLKREAGLSPPWTEDKQFLQWRFCNVHREDDKTTVWFRETVRQHLSGLAAVRSTVIFRWFNRIETGQLIQDLLLDTWSTEEARKRLKHVTPVVTGAYIIRGQEGYSKLEGILQCIDDALPLLEILSPKWGNSLEQAWRDLLLVDYLGGFMAYEIVSDLRWTSVLSEARDILTWANAGPGCARGLGWVVEGQSGRFNCGAKAQKEMLPLMQMLLQMSREEEYWSQAWKPWEMREVEHWSCEFDKYCRARAGDNMKRRYRYDDATV
jgi:alpha-glutamyl/putrescinyl thymine pyrophosphorylase clade 1